jgi:hypothetical protein
MSLHLASAFLTMPTESVRPPSLRSGVMRLLALARRLRPRGVIAAVFQAERLSPADLRDAGLRADQIGQTPIWGHGGIMWRP